MDRPPPSPEEIRAALARVVAGPAFAGARRSADLLRYIVEAVLKTPGRPIKEQELGAEALGRGDKFDPRYDPIARVEASRLRGRLAQHYASEGASDPVRVDLPKGGYVPVFVWAPAGAAKRTASRFQPFVWFAAGAGLAALAAAALFAVLVRQPSAPPPSRAALDVMLGAPGVLADQVGNSLALSPDGSTLAMHIIKPDGSSSLYVRRLGDELEARELPGTTGAASPFFSPDGRWIGFQAGGRVRKTRADGGGSPVTVIPSLDSLGGAWTDSGDIIAFLGSRRAISAIPADGGEPRTLVPFGSDGVDIAWPEALPKSQGFLFTSIDRRQGAYRIEAARLDGSQRRVIAAGGTYPRYAAGHVFYIDRGTLFAQPFDPARLETRGEPRPLARDVAYRDGFGYAFYDVSDKGDLVYLRGSGNLSTINWLDGGEASRPLLATPGRYLFPKLSPDGSKLAFAIADGPVQNLHILDLATGSTTTLGQAAASETFPLWSPDGQRLYIQMEAAVAFGWRPADGSSPAKVLMSGINAPVSLSPDGDRIALHHLSEDTHFDLWTVPLRETADGPVAGEPEVFLATPAIETYPTLSADGRWIAYASNEAGDFDIYVSPFPQGGRRVKLASGSRVPAWSPTKQEIFYTTGDHRIMVQPYTIKDGVFTLGEARSWSGKQLAHTGVYYNFDVAPDGRSVVALLPAGEDNGRARDHFTLKLNALAAPDDR